MSSRADTYESRLVNGEASDSRIDLLVRMVSIEGRPPSSSMVLMLRILRSFLAALAFLEHKLSIACQMEPKNCGGWTF